VSQPSLDLGYDDLPDPTYTVRELADAIKQVLQRGFRDGVWVRGEIEGLQQRNGHTYFTLAERGDEGSAAVPVALFANIAYRLRAMLARHRLTLRDGLAVRIHGQVDFYAASGRLSLLMDGLDPTFTLGQLAADRDQLLRRLVAEGLLDLNRRRPLPVAPLRIGLVTSRNSAAWHDVLTELQRSGYAFHIVHADVRVQGQGAEAQVAAGIAAVAAPPVDVVLVVRGGGARSDLATFDDERIARAIAACPVPVLTGLGHEIDRSVADEVAHTAMKTPTACAAFVVTLVQQADQRAEYAWAAIVARSRDRLVRSEERVADAARRAAARTRHAADVAHERLVADAARARRAAAGPARRRAAPGRAGRGSPQQQRPPPHRRRGARPRSGPLPSDPGRPPYSQRRGPPGRRPRRPRPRARPGSHLGARLVDHAPRRRLARAGGGRAGGGRPARHHVRRRPGHQPSGGDPAVTDADLDRLGYAQALAELEQILDELDGEAVDVDHLAERVQRAAALIRLCRGRLSAARLQIEGVVADLERLGGEP
jgi:exodeoxyribonuclease VII large subunit